MSRQARVTHANNDLGILIAKIIAGTNRARQNARRGSPPPCATATGDMPRSPSRPPELRSDLPCSAPYLYLATHLLRLQPQRRSERARPARAISRGAIFDGAAPGAHMLSGEAASGWTSRRSRPRSSSATMAEAQGRRAGQLRNCTPLARAARARSGTLWVCLRGLLARVQRQHRRARLHGHVRRAT